LSINDDRNKFEENINLPQDNAVMKLSQSLSEKPLITPPMRIRENVLAAVAIQPVVKHIWLWRFLTFLVAILALILFLKPGVMLEWRTNEKNIQSFRLYRSVSNSDNYSLIADIPITNNGQQYHYWDGLIVPWVDYTYKIEAVTDNYDPFVSYTNIFGSLELVIPYAATILFSLITTYSAISLLETYLIKKILNTLLSQGN